MKALLANLSLLATIVSCVYLQRNASEGGDFLAIPKKIAETVSHTTRILVESSSNSSSPSNYSSQVCRDVQLNYDAHENGTLNLLLFGSNRENYLQTEILNKTSDKRDVTSYWTSSFIPPVIPWAVLVVIGILIYIILLCNQCCMVGCCKNGCMNSCRCCKKPKRDRRGCRLFSGLLTLICALGVIGTSAAGIYFSQRFPDNYKQTKCAFFQTMDTIEYGNSTANWVGINGAYNTMATLSSIFNSILSSTYSSATQLAPLDKASPALNTALSGFYSTHQSKTIPSARPGSSATTTPDIIANLGPLDDFSSWLGMLDIERIVKTRVARTAANVIQENYDKIINRLKPFQGYIDSTVNKIQNVDSKVAAAEAKAQTYFKDNVFYTVKNALFGFFIGTLVVSILALLCPICVCLCQKKFFNSCIFVASEIFSLIMLIGFVIGGFFVVVGIFSTQVCDTLNQIVYTPGYFNNVSKFLNIDPTYREYISTCLSGNGELASKIGVTDTIDSLNDLQGQIEQARPILQRVGNAESRILPRFKRTLTNAINGKRLLVADTANQDGTAYNLAEFNLLSDSNLPGSTQQADFNCQVIRDQWVMNTVNCTYTTVWTAGDSNTKNLGSNTCLGVDSAVDTSVRYATNSDIFSTCTTPEAIANDLQDYRIALKNQFDSGKTVLGEVQSDFDKTVQPAWDEFSAAFTGVTAPLTTLEGRVSTIVSLISDPTNGLVNNLNCSFLQNSMRTLDYSMCSGLVVNFYQITLMLLIMAIFACTGSLFKFCFAKYMRTVLEYKDVAADEEYKKKYQS